MFPREGDEAGAVREVASATSLSFDELAIVGGSDPDESNGTSRTRHENTSEPSSKMEVSGKDENALWE